MSARRVDDAANHFRDYERTHYLYRCYDADDVLLYIGCTMDVGSRMMVHASSWQNPASAFLNFHMTRYEVSAPIKGRIAARKAERAAIAAEAPLLNVHHNKGCGLPRVPVKPVTREEMDRVSELIDAWLTLPTARRSA